MSGPSSSGMGLIAWRSVVRHKGRSAFLALCVVIGVAFVAEEHRA